MASTKTTLITVRVPNEELKTIHQMASDRGLPPATVAREAVVAYAQTAKSP